MNPDTNRDARSQMGPDRLPSLPGLRCFEVAARTENFSKAAGELHLTHGAVSRAIRQLEDELRVSLFERRNRAVFLTDAGKRLAACVSVAFADIRRTSRAIRVAGERTIVTVACEPSLMMRWLIPCLPYFEAAHTDVQLRLVAARPGALDVDADLSIRRDDIAWSDEWLAVPLFAEEVGPVCGAAKIGEFFDLCGAAPALRASARLLHTRTRPDAWSRWFAERGKAERANGEQWFEHFYFSLQAASAGLGVAIGPRQLVASDIDAGVLAAPMGFAGDGSTYYLLSLLPLDVDPAVTLAAAWLRSLTA